MLRDWIVDNNDTNTSVFADWSHWADWKTPVRIRNGGGEAIPLRLEPDGSLRVSIYIYML